jgi:hypothetical protein
MMRAVILDASFGQKLWDKGVDISANALSGLFVGLMIAAIALLSWRLQQSWLRRIALSHEAEMQFVGAHNG